MTIEDLFPEVVPGRAFDVGQCEVRVIPRHDRVFTWVVERDGVVLAEGTDSDQALAESDARKAAIAVVIGGLA